MGQWANKDGAARATVLAPTLLVTVTVEAETGRQAPEMHVHAGGQGFWIARMLARLGVEVELCAPCGGDTGELLNVLVEREGVRLRAVRSSRSNGGYVHDRRGDERRELVATAGQGLSRHEIDDLYDMTFISALRSRMLVLSGQYPEVVIPSNVYERLARDVRADGGCVVADVTGEDLRSALKGGLSLLCISAEELRAEAYCKGDDAAQIAAGMRRLARAGAEDVIVHRGAEPTLALLNGRLVQIETPPVTPFDPHGGGDSFLAGLVAGLVSRKGIEEALTIGAAAGCLNVTRHGLGTGAPEQILALSERVRVSGMKEGGRNSPRKGSKRKKRA